MSLYGPTGTAVDSATTDADGIYRFAGLQPGTWSVGVSNLPAGTTVTGRDVGTDDAVDSDVDPVTGRAVATQLTPGESDLSWDAGIHRPATPDIPASSVPSASRLPVTGGEALQLLVFGSALVMIGLLLVRARRPRTL